MDNDQVKNTFRSSIYQMLFSYLLRCICYVVGHSLNPTQMKRLSFITNNFINHDIVNFNSLLKNETKNPFQTMESDCRIKKRRRKIDNITTSNKSSIKQSSYTEAIDPESNQDLFDFKKMYYDLVIIKNNQEEELVKLLKREKDLLSDKQYWKNKYLKLVEDKSKIVPKSKEDRIYMNNVTIGHGSVINCDKEVPVFNSPDIDLSTNKSINNHQTYDNKTKTINDNKTINTTKIINKDDKQLKQDLKNMIFQEFEKLQVNEHTYKDKSLGSGNREFPTAFKTSSSIPSYQAEKIKQLQELTSEILRDEKSVISTLTYRQSKYYTFIDSFIQNKSVDIDNLEYLSNIVDKRRHEFLSNVLDNPDKPDIFYFVQSRLNVRKHLKNYELRKILYSIDNDYLYHFSSKLYNILFKYVDLKIKVKNYDSYKKSLEIKNFILSNKDFMCHYVDTFLECKGEIPIIATEIELPPIEKNVIIESSRTQDSFKMDINPDNHVKDGFKDYIREEIYYDFGHNLPFHYDINES